MSWRRVIPAACGLFAWLCTACADTDEKTFMYEYTYHAADYDTWISARATCFVMLRSTLLNEVYAFLDLEHDSCISSICEDDEATLKAVAAVAVRRDLVHECWDSVRRIYHFEVAATVDKSDARQRVAEILQDEELTGECVRIWHIIEKANARVEALRSAIYRRPHRKEAYRKEYEQQTRLMLVEEAITRGLNAYVNQIYDLALVCYKRAIMLDSALLQPYDYMGNVYYAQHNTTKLLACYRKCIALDSTFVKGVYAVGVGYFRLDKYAEAIEYLERAVRLDSTYLKAYYYLGTSYGKEGKPELAIRYLRKVVDAHLPCSADAYYAMGSSYQALGKEQRALECLEQIVKIAPADVEAYIGLGTLYARQQQYDKASKYLKKAVSVNPSSPLHDKALDRLALLFEERNQLDSAVLYFKREISDFPTVPRNYYKLANVYMKQHRFQEAIGCYTQIGTLSSTDALVYVEIGKAYAAMKDYGRAISSLERALVQHPHDVEALLTMAGVYEMQGNNKQASVYYELVQKYGERYARAWTNE